MNKNEVMAMLVADEKIVPYAYQDSLGYWTIACGKLIDKNKGGGLSETECLYLLSNDVDKCYKDLSTSIFSDFDIFPERIQHVLINMRFQLGYGGFRGFKKMIEAFKAKDYKEAIVQMQDSNWYKQTTKRAERLISIVREHCYG